MNARIKELLASPGLERLNDWASIGPVQKAALEEFAGLIVKECLDGIVTAIGNGIEAKFGLEP